LARYFDRIVASQSPRTSKKKDSDLELVKELLTQYELTVDSAHAAHRASVLMRSKKILLWKKKNHKESVYCFTTWRRFN